MNSPGIAINTNSTLLGSSSSLTRTLTETNDMIYKSETKPDATSGKENCIENLYIECICVKIYILTYEKN